MKEWNVRVKGKDIPSYDKDKCGHGKSRLRVEVKLKKSPQLRHPPPTAPRAEMLQQTHGYHAQGTETLDIFQTSYESLA